MSNLSDLLKQIAGVNSGAVDLLGNTLGAIADLSGGVGAIVGAITELIGLFSLSNDNGVVAKLNDIQAEMEQDFAALNAHVRAENILARQNNLDPAFAQAQAVLDQLQDDLSQNLSQEYKNARIGDCLYAVEQLNKDDKWKTVFADEIYYGSEGDDWWTGIVAPIPYPDGTVFTDRYILPYYLQVLSAFMLVAAAFEPNDWQTRHRLALQRFTTRLQIAYDTSRQGIVTLRMPTREQVGVPSGGYNVRHAPADFGQGGWQYGWWLVGLEPYYYQYRGPGQPMDFGYWFGQEFFGHWLGQEYGVVHTYSGYSSISAYPPIPPPAGYDDGVSWQSTTPPDVFWAQFCGSLNLAIRRNWKEVYAAVGLATVWQTIDTLRRLTGDAPLAAFDADTVWTLREISQILGPPTPELLYNSGGNTISRLAMAGNLPPDRPLSWRSALNAALTAATITPAPPGPPTPISRY